jgi:hypothetical protein
MAVTATTSHSTRKNIQQSLLMNNCAVISKLPNKLNIKYIVTVKPNDICHILDPIVQDICQSHLKARKILIFCRSYSDCASIFHSLAYELSKRTVSLSIMIMRFHSHPVTCFHLLLIPITKTELYQSLHLSHPLSELLLPHQPLAWV